MRHQNSVLHGLLKHVPWSVFDRLVDEHGADRRVRRLSTKSQLVALLHGQFGGASSLREIEAAQASHAGRLYHAGGRPVSRATLADANAKRPAAVFAGLFAHMAAAAGRGLRRRLDEAVRLIDATGLRLAGPGCAWARFSAQACGAKLHVVYDPDAAAPLYAAVSAANVNDITPAKAMPVEPGATYVFDLGYYDFGWWADLDAAGCRIVTRLKANTPLAGAEARPLPEVPATAGVAVLSDRVGTLPRRVGDGRPNPFRSPVREIRVRIETGAVLRLATNDLDAPAEEIAALYRRRWQIELFFRCIKQTLKIRHFLGRSENAVRIQIAVALIAYLILCLARAAQTAVESHLAFTRLVRANLMHRRPIDQLGRARKPPAKDTRQLVLDIRGF